MCYMNCQLCSKLYNRVKKFAAYNIGYIRVGFCYEKNLAYFCPVWHYLKHNLAYFVFVDLATLVGKHQLCTVQACEQRVVRSRKACTLMYRFHEFGNCCSCLTWSCCCELWIMLHVKSIHSRRSLTLTACVDVTCAKLQSYKFHTGFLSTMLKNILEISP